MAVSLLQTLRSVPICFVDTETTGASADFGHRVIEIGIVRVEAGQKVREYQQLINPQRRISPGVTALTGISQAMVDGQPTFAEQFDAAFELMKDAIVVGHNVRFDLSFLRREFRRSGREIHEALPGAHVIDTVRLARKRFGRGGNGLQRLAPRLGIYPSVAHRALADAQTTHWVFEKIFEALAGWETTLADALIAQGGPMGLLPASPRESLLPLELEEALERRKPVMMEYLDVNQQRTHRLVEPINVRRQHGELMLVAHCHLRAAQRTFKIERIVQLTRAEDVPPETMTALEAALPCEPVNEEPAQIPAESVLSPQSSSLNPELDNPAASP